MPVSRTRSVLIQNVQKMQSKGCYMKTVSRFRASLLPVLMRIGRVGFSLVALSLVLGALAPLPTAFASAHNFASRVQIDANVLEFQLLSDTQGFVVGTDLKLWLVHAPFGSVPPSGRTQIDANVIAFQALSATQILVLGTDHNLWLEHAPFGSVPPGRTHIDASVSRFQVVLGTNGQQ